MTFQPKSMLDMAILWLYCLLISFTTVVPKVEFGSLQLPGNDTGCQGDPHGDRLQGLCGQHNMSCCLYTEHDICPSPGFCLTVENGDMNSIADVLPQLPVDNIILLAFRTYSFYSINLRTANLYVSCLIYKCYSLIA